MADKFASSGRRHICLQRTQRKSPENKRRYINTGITEFYCIQGLLLAEKPGDLTSRRLNGRTDFSDPY
jgi:hypothetical protein